MPTRRPTPLQALVHLAGWLPLAHLGYSYLTDNLTANPIQAIEQRTGVYALTFLLLSLACTPVAAILGWQEWRQRRKALGNYGFLYAALHVFTFVVIDYGLDIAAIWRDVAGKSYILVGALAFTLLTPLALTSFNYWMKRLGKNWKRLHRLVYIISPLVVAHYLLAVKGNLARLQGDIVQPLLYGVVIALLLILRLPPLRTALVGLRLRLTSAVQRVLRTA